MGKLIEPIRYLDAAEMQRIHRVAVRILDETGVTIDSTEALDYLAAYGGRVDFDARRVTFPEEVTEASVHCMRSAYANPGRVPAVMCQRYSQIYFSTQPHRVRTDFTTNAGGFSVFILDLDGQRRRATMDDVRAAIRLADALDNITFMGLPCSAQEIPAPMRPVVMAAELVKNTRKLGGVETFDRLDVQFITRIAEVVAGGAAELRRKPMLVGYAEARSPLCIDRNMAEIMIDYVKAGLPQSLDTMPAGGTTAPVTAAGVLAVGIAESLAGLMLGYAVDPDAIMSIDVCPTKADLRTGLYSYASPERMPLLAANVQMMSEFYGCPSGTHGGKTDACYPGVQAGMEKIMSMLFPLLAGSVGIGTMGHLENAVTFSPQQLVIDNELAGSVRVMLEGFEVTEETLAVDVIREVLPGGSFVAHEHTLQHLRDEMHPSKLYDRLNWEAVAGRAAGGLEEKAKEVARKLMRGAARSVLAPAQEAAIDEIVAEAWATRRQLGHL